MTAAIALRRPGVDLRVVVGRVSLGLLVAGAAFLAVGIATTPGVGIDYKLYMAAAARWVDGRGFFLPYQLAGPYAIHYGVAVDPLYPPIVLWLLVPFLVLPAWLWWAIPVAATAWGLARLRPRWWVWPIVLFLFLPSFSWQEFLWGGPSIWVLAFATLGAAYGWPAVLVLVKPTLAPFALFGVRSRSWWIALGALALLSLPFGALWVDWLRAAVVNPTNGGLGYSLPYLPVMCVPVVARFGRTES